MLNFVCPAGETTQRHVPVGLIAALILMVVLLGALIFLWVKYRKREKRRMSRRMMSETTEGLCDAESNGQTISRDSSKDLNKTESENLLYEPTAHSNILEESLPSPTSDTYDETCETKKCLDPTEEENNQEEQQQQQQQQYNNTKGRQYTQMYEVPEPEEEEEAEKNRVGYNTLQELSPENTYRNHRYSRRYNNYGGSYRSYHTRYHNDFNRGGGG
ncbi:hypothetical protein Ahia01_001311300, partial [Argonauta hians]